MPRVVPPVTALRLSMLLGSGLVCFCPGLLDLALAQDHRATIGGQVTDPQGAALPTAVISATHVDTNTSTETRTNTDGAYSLTQLRPGTYRLAVQHAGFAPFARDGIILQTADKVTIDITLALGSLEDRVTVVGALTSVETNRSAIAQTLEHKRLTDLPLNGRQVYMLLQQMPGTLFVQKRFGSTGFSGTRAFDANGAVSIHGSRSHNNEFLIDGAPTSAIGNWQLAPLIDAIEELTVQTSSVDASYGRTSGGIVNMTMKAGTNALRGSGIFVYRGNALDANTTQNNRLGIGNEGHAYADYGGMLGGPLIRNRTFFMGSYHGFAENIPFPRTTTVPTARERLGDFSQTFNALGQPVVIYDPLTTRPDPLKPGQFIRDPFPDNRIPVERLSPAALALLSYYPQPNNAGDPFTRRGNFAASPNIARYRYNAYFGRVDHTFTDRHRLSISNASNWGQEQRNSSGLPIPAKRGDFPKKRHHYLTTIDDVYAAGDRTVINIRASFDRFIDDNPRDYAFLTDNLGITTPFGVVRPAQFPQIHVEGYESLFPSASVQDANQIASLHGSIARTAGRHVIKMGGEVRAYRLSRVNFGDGNGRFQFQRAFTQRDPLFGDNDTGSGLASFLLGDAGPESWVDVNAISSRRYVYFSTYVQDDWQVTPKLTVNMGLRYDVQRPPAERFDRQVVGFDESSPSPLQVPGLDLRGGLLFAGRDGQPGAPYATYRLAFQPRLAVSYRARERLVLRGNYGRSFLPLTGERQERIIQTGFSQRTSLVSSVQTGVPFNTLDRPFPDGILQPANGGLGLATNIGGGFDILSKHFRVPFTDQWMAGVSFDLPGAITVDAAYVGNKTRRLSTRREMNRWPKSEQDKAIARLGGRVDYLVELVPNPLAGRAPGTFLDNASVSRSQLLRPYPQFGAIFVDRLDNGWSDYQAFELAVNRRFLNGIQFSTSYAFMRRREALEYQNPYDEDPILALAPEDQPHRLSMMLLWELPFGRGAQGRIARLIQGWQVNVLGEIESGRPMPLPANGVLRQDSVRLPSGQQSLDRWFDNSTSRNPRPDGSYAWDVLPLNDYRTTLPRTGDVRLPTAPQWALSLFKNTRLAGVMTQVGFEAFNAFNSPIYGEPSSTNVNDFPFGRIVADQINFPRQVQLRFRVWF